MTVNTNIKQKIDVIAQGQKNDQLIKHLDLMTGEDKVLIFCSTKKRSEELSKILNAEGFRTIAIHGDKS